MSCFVVVMGTTSTYVDGATLKHSLMELRTGCEAAHKCFSRCGKKYKDNSKEYYCKKGCATMKSGKAVNLDRFCSNWNHDTYNICITSCAKASGSEANRDICKDGCEFWKELPECSVGELPLEDTFKCQLNGYTCTNGDGPQCCSGRDTETRRCVPCEETMHKKPKGTKYTTRGKCTFQAEDNALLNYDHMGKGYCPSGYYKGWKADADHATMNAEKCAIHCSKEPECKYFAVKPLHTCSRYNSAAGDCPTNGRQDHELYRKTVVEKETAMDNHWKQGKDTCSGPDCDATAPVIVRLHFNETCCSAGGVPEECMGLCREKVEDRSLFDEERNVKMVMPVDRCVEHRDTIRACMIAEVHCEWHDWQLGECSQTCGGGTRMNTRTKKTEEQNGGTCEGEATMEDVCNTQVCPPIHCVWNDWVTGECSDTCGSGTRKNTRTKLVTEENGGTCTGPPTEIEECNTNPCPIDCEWNDWAIGECSLSCGGGTLTKIRTPKVDAQHGGKECHGHASVTESCNVQECPVDCVWNEWALGECTTTCGGGTQTDTREQLQEALFGGNPCEGESSRKKECNPDPCPVDCEWNEWVLGDCSTTCGNGTQINKRTKLQEELHGGVCVGEPMETLGCNVAVCPPIHCVWNEWMLGECSKSCGTGTRTNLRTKKVYEEFGGTCTGQPSEIEECLVVECPVHCVWDEWIKGDCDKTCGGGLLTKSRQPLQHAQHGGNDCPGATQLTESCNVQECPVDCVWDEWVTGTCSQTCGDGVLVDTRRKLQEEMFGGLACEGEPTRQTNCSIAPCPIIFHFNETCCSVAYGIPEQCMGLCRERIHERVEVILPIDQCDEYKDAVRSCLYSESGHTLEEAHAIFPKSRSEFYQIPKSRSIFGSIMDWINY